jgi:hypothetical protein
VEQLHHVRNLLPCRLLHFCRSYGHCQYSLRPSRIIEPAAQLQLQLRLQLRRATMMNSAILRRGLVTTTSGAAAVTLARWCGERTASRTTSRVASRAVAQWHLSPRNLPATGRTFSSSTTSTTTTTTTAAATATKSAVEKQQAESSQKSFVQWYEGHLEARPILTKAVTGSILWGIGDVVAQVFPHLSEGSLDTLDYDWMRTGRAVTFGGVIHAPTSHLHFNFLEWMTVRTGFSGLQIPIFKTFMEQVRVGRVPVCVCVCVCVCAYVDGSRMDGWVTFAVAHNVRRFSLLVSWYLLTVSSCTGVGFRIRCIMLLWAPCKDKDRRKYMIASVIY